MWCSACQQDVPVVSPHASNSKCPRCKQSFNASTRPLSAATATQLDMGLDLDAKVAPATPPVQLDDWDFSERLKRIERLLARQMTPGERAKLSTDASSIIKPRLEFQSAPNRRESSASVPQENWDREVTSIRRSRGAKPSLWLAWALVIFGAGTWYVGSTAWAYNTFATIAPSVMGRISLSELGAIVVGIGVCVAAARVVSMMRRVDKRLESLDATTSDLRYSLAYRNSNSGGAAFYADLARGASPGMLLADLKGQVDRLAVRMVADRDW